MASLFTSQTPVNNNNNDGSAPGISTGTRLWFDVSGQVSGVRFWATDSAIAGGGTYIVELWEATSGDDTPAGTRVGVSSSVAAATLTENAWNTINFASPISVAAGTIYTPVVNSSVGRYVNTANFFTSSGLSNAGINAPQSGVDPVGVEPAGIYRNGVFTDGTAGNSYPASPSGNQSSYFVDVIYTAGAESHSTTVAATLGLAVAETATKGARKVVDVTLSLAAAETATKRAAEQVAATLGLAVALTESAARSMTLAATLGLAVEVAVRNGATPAGGSGNGGWWSLISILREEADTARYYQAQPPTACPNDGEPLRYGPAGELFCPFDGWRWDG